MDPVEPASGAAARGGAEPEARLGDHIPMSILVSCKDHSRPLDIGEAEMFAAEMRSLGATQGVLYSRSGFTLRAIARLPQELLCRTLATKSVFAGGPCSFPAPTARDIPAMLSGIFQQTAPRPGFTIEADFGRADR